MKRERVNYSTLNNTSNFNIFEEDYNRFDDLIPAYIKESIIESFQNSNYDSDDQPMDFILLNGYESLFDSFFMR